MDLLAIYILSAIITATILERLRLSLLLKLIFGNIVVFILTTTYVLLVYGQPKFSFIAFWGLGLIGCEVVATSLIIVAMSFAFEILRTPKANRS
jgi:hypothetical protein